MKFKDNVDTFGFDNVWELNESYLDLNDFLENPEDVRRVEESMKVLTEFFESGEDQDKIYWN